MNTIHASPVAQALLKINGVLTYWVATQLVRHVQGGGWAGDDWPVHVRFGTHSKVNRARALEIAMELEPMLQEMSLHNYYTAASGAEVAR